MTQALPSTGVKRCSWDMSLTDTQVDDVLWAARTGDLEVWNILKKELDVTAALASSNDSGNTALHYAAANGHLEFVRQVLPQANLEILLLQNESGNTPLHWAAFNGHLNVAEALVDRIEALEMQDEVTAKRLRAEEDQREHQRHAEKNLEEKDESEDARKAELAHHDEMQSERALWDVRNKAGRGPMSEAQMTDREEVVQMLLSHLCDNARPSPQSTDDLTTRTDNLHVSEA